MTRAVAADLNMEPKDLKRYLRSWYKGVRDMMEYSDVSVDGMDDAATVRTLLQSGAIDNLLAKLPETLASDTMPPAHTESNEVTGDDPTGEQIRVDTPAPLGSTPTEDVSPTETGGDAEPASPAEGRGNRGQRASDDGAGDVSPRGGRTGAGRSVSGTGVSRGGKKRSPKKPDSTPQSDLFAPKSAEAQTAPDAATAPQQNFKITPELRLGQGGMAEKFADA
ncbi:hypothetical protein ACGYJ8_13880 [Sulfitobacter sp. 1A12126]|uniref:hypothetical protein n=1 Tax=Sulfitobacter sp. 1A12126 TaxID=3368591 RepID=UPI003745CA4D